MCVNMCGSVCVVVLICVGVCSCVCVGVSVVGCGCSCVWDWGVEGVIVVVWSEKRMVWLFELTAMS